jgi:hypothetical protein
MDITPIFKRRLVRRDGFFSVSIPPELGKLFGKAEFVQLRAESGGIIISAMSDKADFKILNAE